MATSDPIQFTHEPPHLPPRWFVRLVYWLIGSLVVLLFGFLVVWFLGSWVVLVVWLGLGVKNKYNQQIVF